jgi:hypothetical protein
VINLEQDSQSQDNQIVLPKQYTFEDIIHKINAQKIEKQTQIELE